MRVVEKKLLVSPRGEDAAFPGFVSYVGNEGRRLLQCYGWEQEDDNRDGYAIYESLDNGKTWAGSITHLNSTPTENGVIRYTEFGSYWDSDTEILLVIATLQLYPKGKLNLDSKPFVKIMMFNPKNGKWQESASNDFGFRLGLAVSFCFPVKLKNGRILVPACHMVCGPNGKPLYVSGSHHPAYQSLVLVGEYNENETISWHPSQPIPLDANKSVRGWDENTIVELSDGRVAMLIRGSNVNHYDLPGYKWVSYSDDYGESWSCPTPWQYDDGTPVRSSASGSCLLRSTTDGQIFWIGNIALDGVPVKGNFPRSPLVIGKVDESKFTLKKNSLVKIDEWKPGQSQDVQFSNFRYYQDRDNGDIVLYLTNFGEQPDPKDWKRAGYYQYRVTLQ